MRTEGPSVRPNLLNTVPLFLLPGCTERSLSFEELTRLTNVLYWSVSLSWR